MSAQRYRVVLVGGLERLDALYRQREDDVRVDVVHGDSPALSERVDGADGVVVVMGMISHSAAHKVQRISRQRGMPMMRAGGPGLGNVRRTIDALVSRIAGASP